MRTLVTVVATLAVIWSIAVAVLAGSAARTPDRGSVRAAARMAGDTTTLVRRLALDPRLPLAARLPVWLVLGYLVVPFDLVPDVVPMLGQVDDVLLVAVVLRRLVRRAGGVTLAEHWPGTADGLAALCRTLRLPAPA